MKTKKTSFFVNFFFLGGGGDFYVFVDLFCLVDREKEKEGATSTLDYKEFIFSVFYISSIIHWNLLPLFKKKNFNFCFPFFLIIICSLIYSFYIINPFFFLFWESKNQTNWMKFEGLPQFRTLGSCLTRLRQEPTLKLSF